ncbi:Gfo/Idh/MocA family protein [Polaribacter dokdonensis]|uniref:Oxidoreductase family protein n=1 Tax=Polaribacter dokdonensis DSW-5 TaxID=1300348 RepID=A0A0M9CED5_9FLAO|nr:Gfo/Idh/MocA family oxidoreductase [Polaribacter dokdonensis]KOY50676.1 Oxidoreductase family protein [Polaribacter dokdonensis DSW-5]SEE62590.1 UDP-N-acetyl-2-amino-2-deoxyglucuronate dehydrogenase [Polaribacter dokdonensis DSW-5]
MKNFGLIGAAGYIAPRHLRAIKETNNQLLCALDKFDSVGVLDQYFSEAHFFVEFERFDRHIEKLKRDGQFLDYISICTPNYLHDAHIRMALRAGADAICEKPLVLNPWNFDALQEIEKQYEKRIHTILQLRLHPSIIQLKERILKHNSKTKHEVDLTYITSRGKWYDISWKGDEQKSGGVATNIGVHFFDMLSWIFGDVQEIETHLHEKHKASGYLEFENARVRWYLSIDANDLPKEIQEKQQRTFRSITVDGNELEFSNGFTDLHTLSYQEILKGNGFNLEEAKPSIEIIHTIRNQEANFKYSKHPFL